MKRSDICTREVLWTCLMAKLLDLPSLDLLIKRTNAPFKVALRAMERDEDKGLLDCGISIRWAWVTEKGKLLLNTKVS